MSTQTVLLLIASAVIALLVAIFQYIFKAKSKSKQTLLFAFLRFLTVFTLLVLLVNPQITITKTKTEKPDLILLTDQSKSIDYLGQKKPVKQVFNKILNNSTLKERFNIFNYGFGEKLSDSVSDNFNNGQTQIYNTLKDVQKIHRKSQSPMVLLTDGNQTYGSDYAFYKSNYEQPIYSIAFGDTTRVDDFKISRVNANKYAYLNNKFPIEVLVRYSGKTARESQLQIYKGKQLVFKKKLSFTAQKTSEFVDFTVKATQVGLHSYTARILPFTGEKNQDNNNKSFVVETIDQKTNVLLVSTITHPDIAAFKRTIESNERRSLIIKKPNEVSSLEGYQLLILYQPKATFKPIYEMATKKGIQLLTVTGKQTDWTFLNGLKRKYQKKISTQDQEIIATLASNFTVFNTEQFNLDSYPPVESGFGQETLTAPYETLLFKKIANVETTDPLLAFWENNTANEAVFFGEGFWKWRLANYKRDGDFKKFDNFFGKVIQFLSSKRERKRLTANYESTYYSANTIKLTASYFNKNYEFDTKGKLLLTVNETETKSVKKLPMVLKTNYYEADLSDLLPGNYTFSIKAEGTKLKTFGRFNVLDFDIEKQFFRPNIESLFTLSKKNNGNLYYPNQLNKLIDNLVKSDRFKPVQKSKQEKLPLISWKLMLGLLLALLSLEWFLRKYNGLI
ncbi:hypothetical protein [Aquimarina agarilytica]|uniref:hypothetical protein n=1 Tax=Aquimarina agarilytica TaxID=1087449 RepID=UPI000287E75D|nr:hypothetical protein [Aquimarina agarilytica]